MKALFLLVVLVVVFFAFKGCRLPTLRNAAKSSSQTGYRITPPDLRQSRGPQKTVLVVLDPGHGGYDSGCVYGDKTHLLVEDEYVYDVCCRAKHLLEARDFRVIFTIEDSVTHYNERPEGYLPPDANEFLIQAPHLIIRGSAACMDARLEAIKAGETKYHPDLTFWVSVHFDCEKDESVGGACIATPDTGGVFTRAMLASFEKASLERQKGGVEYSPVYKNGTPRYLYILRPDRNPCRRCVLIELGNFTNLRDRTRVQDPEWRSIWAETIVSGIEAAAKTLPSK